MIWKNSIPLNGPLLLLLNNPAFVLGCCSAVWLRGPERAKLANSLEDIYVWVPFIIFDFMKRYRRGILATSKAFIVIVFHDLISL